MPEEGPVVRDRRVVDVRRDELASRAPDAIRRAFGVETVMGEDGSVRCTMVHEGVVHDVTMIIGEAGSGSSVSLAVAARRGVRER